MKHIGDITKIHGYDIEPVDCITGGSPCQDLSLAGKRAGLAGERSGLFMEQVRIIKEMRDATRRTMAVSRDGVKPRFQIWENVGGAFSSNSGRDFQAVLTEIARIADPECPDVPMPDKGRWSKSGCIYDKLGRWSIAWRLHDAQFWGVPQRRKRIALVADFGGMSAPEVLFERKGLRWYPGESGTEGQGTAGNPAAGTGKAISFQERAGKPGGGKGILIQDDKAASIRTQQNQSVMAVEPILYTREFGGNVHKGDVTPTLEAAAGMGGNNMPIVTVALESNGSRPSHRGDGYSDENEPMFTLNTTEQHAIAYGIDQQGGKGGANYTEDIAPTMASDSHGTPHAVAVANYKADGSEGDGKAFAVVGDHENRPTDMTNLVCYNGETITSPQNKTDPKPGDPCHTLTNDSRNYVVAMSHGGFMCNANDSGVGHTLEASDYKDPQVVMQNWDGSQVSPTLTANNAGGGQRMPDKNNFNAVYGIDRSAYNQGQNAQFKPQFDEDLSASLIAKGPNAVATHTVRRLTPLECERLQGYPDGWTDIGDWTDSKGKVHQTSDSARYKALGNSIALPFWFYLLRRISAQYERPATLGSLFDGISGFPLSWERCNGKGTAKWSSEIEEFPIAVCKKHFGDEETGEEGDVGQYL